jgi:hypothetical protein
MSPEFAQNMLADKLQALLDRTTGEREVTAFLKKHPAIVLDALVRFGDGSCVVADFPFGTEFEADFVALAPFSGGWEIHFVELEPPNARLFNSNGTAARRLNQAIAQVSEWRTFIEKNRPAVLRDLVRFAKDRDLIRGPREEEPTCHVGWPIDHRRATHILHYDIVVGRRGALTDEEIERKSSFKENHKVEVMTFDRFVEAARSRESRFRAR